jgi:hypothetical protein
LEEVEKVDTNMRAILEIFQHQIDSGDMMVVMSTGKFFHSFMYEIPTIFFSRSWRIDGGKKGNLGTWGDDQAPLLYAGNFQFIFMELITLAFAQGLLNIPLSICLPPLARSRVDHDPNKMSSSVDLLPTVLQVMNMDPTMDSRIFSHGIPILRNILKEEESESREGIIS